MKAYKGILLGMGMLGIYGCATMNQYAPQPGDIAVKPSGKTYRFVENHMGREDLSFLEVTYQFKELGGEIIYCYPKNEKQKHFLRLVKEGGRVVKAEIKDRSSCKRCHWKWPPDRPKHTEYKRQPMPPDAPLDTA